MVGPIDVALKGSVTLTFDLTHDIDLGFQGQILKHNVVVSQELLIWLMWNEKEAIQLDTVQTVYVSLRFDHTHDLDFEFCRSKF